MNVRFCPSCRSLILADFRYCPYCGQSVVDKGPDLSEALEAPFASMERDAKADEAPQPAGHGQDVFAGARERLERLETEMDLLLAAMEKEGRSPK